VRGKISRNTAIVHERPETGLCGRRAVMTTFS
jgi:hypothetical protein